MSKPKIYISGQITGLSMTEVMTAFYDAEMYLTEKGYDVINPLAIAGHNTISEMKIRDEEKWVLHMKLDIKALMDCESIYMLNNYKQSKGAMIEFSTALQFGYKILFEDEPLNLLKQ